MAKAKLPIAKKNALSNALIESRTSADSLQTSIERLSKAFYDNPSGMIITRLADGKIIDLNKSYERLVGFSAEELLGNTGQSLNVQSNAEERQSILERLQRDGFVRDYETTLRTKSGALLRVLFSLELIELDNEQCILSSLYDITDRKQAEEILRVRERFQALLNDMTRTILLARDFDTTLDSLATEMAKLIGADDCYITYWDDERKLILPTATTIEHKNVFMEDHINNENEASLTASILTAGHALVVEDVFDSPYISVEVAKRYPTHCVLGLPLIARERKLGAAIIAFNSPHHFTSIEIEYAEQAATQVALALWSFQQSKQIEQRLTTSRTLMNIERELSQIEHGGSDRVLQLIVDSALNLITNAEGAVIHILRPDENILLPMAIAGFAQGVAEKLWLKMQMGKGIAGQVMRDGITINISDVERDPRFLRVDNGSTFRSLMVAPVRSGKQQIGTISVQSRRTNAFSMDDEELLNALAINAGIAIDNTRSFEATQQRLREVNALYGTIQVLAASLNPQELANDVVNLLQKNFGFYYVQFYRVDSSNGGLILKAGSGEVGEQLLRNHFSLPRGMGIIGHVAETGEPFFTNNVNDVVFFTRNPLLPDTQFELAMPVKIGTEIVGVLDIQDKPPKQFSRSDLQLVQAVADQLAVALDKANLYTDLQNAMRQEQAIRTQLIQSERLALVGRLLASVSHELNNPLQAIQNALFLLKEESGLSIQGRQDLGIVLSETERMAALIERLRSAYRPIRDKDFQPVDINNLIEDVYALISTHMRHKNIMFEFVPDPDLQPAWGIDDQLRQVALNLFLNAIEVMEPGGYLTVQTQNLPDQGQILFSVKDTGPGIDEEILPKIFDAFVTSKYSGTGLGLTITHDILEQHQGRISAENHPEGGAIFYVWLPMPEEA
jgi:PAS domain S-box-containing protein